MDTNILSKKTSPLIYKARPTKIVVVAAINTYNINVKAFRFICFCLGMAIKMLNGCTLLSLQSQDKLFFQNFQ